MLARKIIARLSKRFKKIPLRLVLVVPFAVEIFAAVGLTGWLALQNGQKAVNDVATNLRSEITARIQLQLQTYLTTPHLINQMNADAYSLGQVNLEEFSVLQRHFWQQMQRFDKVSYISVGTEIGYFIGIERLPNNKFRVVVTDENTNGDGYQYATDAAGNRTKIDKINRNYDPRVRPWYQAAVKAGAATWSEIYPVFAEQQLTITAGLPVYDKNGTLKGVFITDLILSHINEFLRSLKIGKTGQTFIIERSGELVASSTSQKLFVSLSDGSIKRLKASESNYPLIKTTDEYLNKSFKGYNNLLNNCQKYCQLSTSFEIKNQRYFVQVTPLINHNADNQDSKLSNSHRQPSNTNNLQPISSKPPDWLIVVVVPEADFMEQIEANTRFTILLCVLALLVAGGVGLLTSHWVLKPIIRLNHAAAALAEGDWNQVVPVEGLLELGMLATTFNQMTTQLRLVYADLEANVMQLIQAQEALKRNETKYRELVQNANSAIVRLNTTGHITFFNEFAQSFFGYGEHEILGNKITGTIVPELDSSGRNLISLIDNILQYPEEYSRTENENMRRNGERVWVAWTTKALRDEQGKLTGILLIGSDITDRKRAEDALFQRERYLAALVELQNRLLASQSDSYQDEYILSPLGEAAGASRVYLFENHRDSQGRLLTSQKAEWCAPNISPTIHNSHLQNLAYETFFQRWLEVLSRGELIVGFVRDLPLCEREILEPQGIISLLILPLMVGGQFFGFIGFDNCTSQRIWESLEVDLLRAAAAAISLHQERVLAESALKKANEVLEIRVRERTAQVRASEARFRRLSEATFEGIMVHEDGRILDYNQALARMFGYDSENFVSQFLDYIAPEYQDLVAQKMASGDENCYEAVGVTKNGSQFPIEIEAKVIPDKNYQLRVVAVRDITERKQAEQALRDSEQKFSTAFRQSPNAITITTIPNACFLDVSDGFLKITGYSREEVIGRTAFDLNLWASSQERRKINKLLKKHGSLRNHEVNFRNRDQEILVGLLSAEVISLGGVNCLLAVTSDITERKKALDALARALQEQESIFEAQLDIIFVFDLNLRLIKWNKQMEVVTGFSPSQLKNRWALDFFPPSERQMFFRGIQSALNNPENDTRIEGHLIAKNGFLLDYQFTGVALKDEKGRVIGFTGAGRDITETKRAASILKVERENSERLLLNILPKTIAERLKKQTGPIAESFRDSTVMFADIVGFTQLSSSISPPVLVSLLNQIFSQFDQLADRHGLEKIKTIGDAYMVVSGVPVPRTDHAEAMAEMALDMLVEIEQMSKQLDCNLNIRIGIHSGPVVAGVIGLKKFIYDLWGDTVNTASRMESHGIPGSIQVTDITYQRLHHKYHFEDRGIIEVKGKGAMKTYLLKSRRLS